MSRAERQKEEQPSCLLTADLLFCAGWLEPLKHSFIPASLLSDGISRRHRAGAQSPPAEAPGLPVSCVKAREEGGAARGKV